MSFILSSFGVCACLIRRGFGLGDWIHCNGDAFVLSSAPLRVVGLYPEVAHPLLLDESGDTDNDFCSASDALRIEDEMSRTCSMCGGGNNCTQRSSREI
jgi:hypothetical protein